MTSKTLNRREFLKRSLAASIASSSLVSTLTSLQTVKAASLDGDFSDYKALVCVFLMGGNDSMNMVVPTDASLYQNYAQSRSGLAVPLNDVLTMAETDYGFSPDAAGFADLFASGKLAVVANTGSLIEPVTKAAIDAGTATLPPQLHSHNDQQKLWMAGTSSGLFSTGWAGRIADLLQDQGIATSPAANLNFGRNELIQRGALTHAFSLNRNGTGVETLKTQRTYRARRNHDAYVALAAQNQNHVHPMVRQYAEIQQRSLNTTETMSNVLENAPELASEFTEFGRGRFAAQLQTTAKIIASRGELGAQRQIFFLTLGGWDTHASQAGKHAALQQELTTNLKEFQIALEGLGLADKVTTFTSSEFGRTLSINGDGTDHGWGGHSFVLGGAVDGGKIVGTMPSLELDSDDDKGKGRIIPTTSVDQYLATLSKWFGLSDSQAAELFPNLGNFDSADLGFMQTA